MSSGQPRVIFNTRERIISDDQNLAQAFEGRHVAQLMRRLLNRRGSQRHPLEYPGQAQDMTGALPAQPNGTLHDVLGGLLVRPDNGLYLLVDPGSAGFYFPGYAGLTANDSPYIIVDDPGVVTTDVLTFTANSSGSPRIDIVECRPVDTLLTSDNRDIYNTTTGEFSPALVEKTRTARLEYRIRLGTPDAGFPALDSGWCPLAFAVVQTGAAGFNECDFYDVRPLVSERDDRTGPWVDTQASAAVYSDCVIDDRSLLSNATTNSFQGWVRGSFQGYRFGGTVSRNTASTIATFGDQAAGGGDFLEFEFLNTANWVTTGAAPVSTTVNQANCLVAVFPRGLGRCVRYTQNATPTNYFPTLANPQQALTGRQPRGFNGILVVARPTQIAPMRACRVDALPLQFGATTTANYQAAVVGWLVGDGSTLQPFEATGKFVWCAKSYQPSKAFTVSALPNASPQLTCSIGYQSSPPTWTPTAGGSLRLPGTAVMALCSIGGGVGFASPPTSPNYTVIDAEYDGIGTGLSWNVAQPGYVPIVAPNSGVMGVNVDIPMSARRYPGESLGPNADLVFNLQTGGGGNVTSTNVTLRVRGWVEF